MAEEENQGQEAEMDEATEKGVCGLRKSLLQGMHLLELNKRAIRAAQRVDERIGRKGSVWLGASLLRDVVESMSWRERAFLGCRDSRWKPFADAAVKEAVMLNKERAKHGGGGGGRQAGP